MLVGVALARGSCPREAGTRMVVAADTTRGTIGGGHLEYRAIGIARDMLATSSAPPPPRLERFPLGASLGQCCGGLVHLSFEHVPAERPPWVARLLALERAGRAATVVTRFEPESGPSAGEPRARAGKRVITSAEDEDAATDDGERTGGERWRRAEVRAREVLRESPSPGPRWEPPFLYEPFAPHGFDIRLFGAVTWVEP